MPRRTTVRLVLLALVALATSAKLADAQAAGRASAPTVTSGRRPDVDIQVDRPSSRGSSDNKYSNEICGGFGNDPLGFPSLCLRDVVFQGIPLGDELCQRQFPCKKSKCSTKRIHTNLIPGLQAQGLKLPEAFDGLEIDGRSSKDFDFDLKDLGLCVCDDDEGAFPKLFPHTAAQC
jgi:hypothetical protein